MAESAVSELRSLVAGRRVALVHEWLSSFAGSEQTFLAMAEALPEADLFALSYNKQRSFSFGDREVRTSFLDRHAQDGGRGVLLPLMPAAMRRLSHGRTYDLVITSCHAFSRAFVRKGTPLHLSYTYTPARYLWTPELERHRSRLPVPDLVRGPLRHLDRRLADRVDHFAGISHEIQDRISAYYDRPSTVVFPPVDTEYFTLADTPTVRSGALAVSRLVSYKKIDVAIEACAIAGVPLTVIGSGP